MTEKKRRYHLAEDTIDRSELRGLAKWLTSGPWLTQGSLVKKFEAKWARWLGVDYSILVNSGSSANLLMYYVLLLSGRLKNRKVIVPAIGWATTIMPAIQLGFEPILCDVDPDTFGLDPAGLRALARKHRPGAVIVVHVLGVPARMPEILKLRQEFDFLLMEDACAAHGSRYEGKRVGTFGDLSSFSFFYGHQLSTIEGGMVSTNDEELADILTSIRAHGWARDLPANKEAALARRYRPDSFNRRFTFYYPGFNVRSTDLNAWLGLSQMKKIEWVIRRRAANHRIYQHRFGKAGWRCQRNDDADIVSISFVALADSLRHRQRIAAVLAREHIETRPLGGGNMGRQPFWVDRYGLAILPAADEIHARAFQLPNHPGLAPEDITAICDIVLAVAPNE